MWSDNSKDWKDTCIEEKEIKPIFRAIYIGGDFVIAQQPNGKYCRFSSVIDTFTHINMAAEDYIFNITGTVKNKEDGIDTLKNHLYHFTEVINSFIPNNMSTERFNELVAECSKEDGEYYEVRYVSGSFV